jgi:hypothetical protein
LGIPRLPDANIPVKNHNERCRTSKLGMPSRELADAGVLLARRGTHSIFIILNLIEMDVQRMTYRLSGYENITNSLIRKLFSITNSLSLSRAIINSNNETADEKLTNSLFS